eukprot:scaffold2045_cov404-Prasinococcus_capsulatus_cf.AAC.41
MAAARALRPSAGLARRPRLPSAIPLQRASTIKTWFENRRQKDKKWRGAAAGQKLVPGGTQPYAKVLPKYDIPDFAVFKKNHGQDEPRGIDQAKPPDNICPTPYMPPSLENLRPTGVRSVIDTYSGIPDPSPPPSLADFINRQTEQSIFTSTRPVSQQLLGKLGDNATDLITESPAGSSLARLNTQRVDNSENEQENAVPSTPHQMWTKLAQDHVESWYRERAPILDGLRAALTSNGNLSHYLKMCTNHPQKLLLVKEAVTMELKKAITELLKRGEVTQATGMLSASLDDTNDFSVLQLGEMHIMKLFTDGLRTVDLTENQMTALIGIEKAAREGDEAVHTGVKTILDSMANLTHHIIREQQMGRHGVSLSMSELDEVERLLWVFLTLVRSSATLRVKTLDSILSILSDHQAANFHISCADKSNRVRHYPYPTYHVPSNHYQHTNSPVPIHRCQNDPYNSAYPVPVAWNKPNTYSSNTLHYPRHNE